MTTPSIKIKIYDCKWLRLTTSSEVFTCHVANAARWRDNTEDNIEFDTFCCETVGGLTTDRRPCSAHTSIE